MFNYCVKGGIPKKYIFLEIYCLSRDNLIPYSNNNVIYWTIKNKYKLLDKKYLLKTFIKRLYLTYQIKIIEPIYIHIYHLEIPDEYSTRRTKKFYQKLFNYQYTTLNNEWIPFYQYFNYIFNHLKQDHTYKLIIRICRKEYKHLIS